MKNILYEDDSIIVAYKPAGIATQTARVGQLDMVSELKNHIKASETGISGEPYLGLVHRLDQPVSGLLVFGKTKDSSSALSKQLNLGILKKYYYAIVLGRPKPENATLTDYIYKDRSDNLSHITDKDHPDAKHAILKYHTVKTLVALEDNAEASLLDIELLTGRHHQIRLQLSNAGFPILGDSKYGNALSKELSRDSLCKTPALCAYKLMFNHPKTGKELTFERIPKDGIFRSFI